MKQFAFALFVLLAIVSETYAQTTIYSQDFSSNSLPSGWTNVDNTGTNPTNGIWKRYTSATFQSTTYANGYWLFLSDGNSNDNLHEDASLTSGPINCSSNAKVFLQFQHYFSTYFTNNTNSEGKVFVSNDGTNWTEIYSVIQTSANPEIVNIDLTQYAANQATVYIRFKFTGDWDGFWAVDDVKIIEPAVLDVAVDAVPLEKYIHATSQTITAVVSNQGSSPVNIVTLAYTINGGSPVSQTFNSLSLEPFQKTTLTFSTPADFLSVNSYDVVVTASAPNGGSDLVSGNNTASGQSVVLSAFPVKNVLLEEFTTAPCQFCPDGSTRLNHILDNNTRMIGAALHAGFGTDGMTTTDHSTLAGQYSDFAPALMIDRVYYESETGTNIGYYNDPYDRWEPYAQTRKGTITPVSIEASNTYNSGTRTLTVDVSATFYGVINSPFRVNCYIIEDSVSGTGSGYNQVNGSNGDNTSEWYQKGNPIVGYKHRHVTRYMMGGAWGSAAVVPTTTADGVPYTKQYTYTLPAGWNDSRIKLVALVQHYNVTNKYDREILNAMEFDLNSSGNTGGVVSSIVENSGNALQTAGLYPNPANDFVTVEYSLNKEADFSMEVYNLVGEVTTTFPHANLGEGNYTTRLNTSDYTNGIYFIVLKENGKSVQTLKFVVSK